MVELLKTIWGSWISGLLIMILGFCHFLKTYICPFLVGTISFILKILYNFSQAPPSITNYAYM